MLDEAQKHGKSTTGVSVAFGKGDDVCTGDLIKRNQNSEMKKAVKLSKRELNPNLVSLIETGEFNMRYDKMTIKVCRE